MAIQIPLETIDAKAFESLDKLSANLTKLEEKADKFAKTLADARAPSDAFTATLAKRRTAAESLIGPYQRLQRAQENLARAQKSGDLLQLLDAQYKLKTAQGAANRADTTLTGKSTGAKLRDALMTSRVDLSTGHIMPLVNRMVGALGLPLEAMLGTAIVGSVIKSGAEVSRNRAAAFYGGGASANTGVGLGYASYAGGSLAQDAMQFGDALRGGGIGASYMRSKGIVDFGYRTIDKVTNLTKAINELAGIQDLSTRIMIARSVGLENYVDLAGLGPGTRKALADSIPTPTANDRRLKGLRDADANQWQNFWDNAQTSFSNTVSTPYLDLKDAMENGGIGRWGRAARTLGLTVGGAALGSLVPGGTAAGGCLGMEAAKWFDERDADAKKVGGGRDVQKAQLDELRSINRKLKDTREIVGDSARASRAIPPAWRYLQLESGIKLQAQRLGSY